MGRDINFSHEELGSYEHQTDYSLFKQCYMNYNVKTHRTGLHHGDEPYESYGVMLWLDKDGKPKKKGKKEVHYEEQSYQPKDYTKTWEVPIAVGDYEVTVLRYLDSWSVIVVKLEEINYVGGTPFKLKEDGKVMYEGLDREYKLEFSKVGLLEGKNYDASSAIYQVIPVEKIREVYEEKFWDVLEKVTKVPKFKKVKGYDKFYF